MQYVYEPFILRRAAEGRIFFVAPKMPFEYFVYCFQNERPFFLASQLEDGRVAVTPNAMFIPLNLLQAGYWPQDLLPAGFEYVTMKNGNYPVIISAHPVTNFDEWTKMFFKCVEPFAKQSLQEFISSTTQFKRVELTRETGFPIGEHVTA